MNEYFKIRRKDGNREKKRIVTLKVEAGKYNTVDHLACSYIKTLDRCISSTQGEHVKTGELVIQIRGQH